MAFNVFISWSGARSYKVARALTVWLKEVNQFVETLISEMIPSGAGFFLELTSMLRQADFAVVVVVPENWDNPWISLEPGVIIGKGAPACPYLVALNARRRDLPEPLKFLQAKTATYEGTYELVKDINAAAGSPLSELQLKKSFDEKWPELWEVIKSVNNVGGDGETSEDGGGTPPRRPSHKDCTDDFMRVSGLIESHQTNVYGIFHDLIFQTADDARCGRYDREKVIRKANNEIEKSIKKIINDAGRSLLVGDVAAFFASHFKTPQLVEIIQEMETEMRPEDFDEKRRYVGDLGVLQRKWAAQMGAAVSKVFLIFHRALLDKLGECNKLASGG
jgi:hypothetical protein